MSMDRRSFDTGISQSVQGDIQGIIGRLESVISQRDQAVAAAYGWPDFTPATPDDDILKRLLALNLTEATHG